MMRLIGSSPRRRSGTETENEVVAMINETVPTVVAEYRRDLHDMIVKKQYVPTADYLTRLLDRIEAADNSANGRRMQRLAPGNAAAMREALETIHNKVNSLDEDCGVDPVEVMDLARAALSAPARQCDVGTAEEQMKRFDEFTSKYWPLGMSALQWAQTPYEAEEGVAE